MPPLSTVPRRGGRRPAFRLVGFPVHVRPGFLVFMVLLVVLNGDSPSFGLWLAVLMAAFTLLHELGHALAARAADLYRRAAISLAGPAVQIVAGLAVYLAVGGDLGWPLHGETAAQYAALWAGPVIGVCNLAPILPFDGGHVVQVVVERFAPTRARSIMYTFTLVMSGLMILLMVSRPEWRSFDLRGHPTDVGAADAHRRPAGRSLDRTAGITRCGRGVGVGVGRPVRLRRLRVRALALVPRVATVACWARRRGARRARRRPR